MVRRRIQYNIDPAKGIELQIHLDFDGENVILNKIELHSNYGSGYPINPQIKFLDSANEYQFYTTYEKEIKGKTQNVYEFFIDDNIRGMIKEIHRIMEEERPHFIK